MATSTAAIIDVLAACDILPNEPPTTEPNFALNSFDASGALVCAVPVPEGQGHVSFCGRIW